LLSSGTGTHDVNQLLNQFTQMQKLMKMGANGKIPKNMMGHVQIGHSPDYLRRMGWNSGFRRLVISRVAFKV